jgi:hypothetical protein
MAVLHCAYDQQSAVVAHVAARRSGSDDPAAVFVCSVPGRAVCNRGHRLVVEDRSVPSVVFKSKSRFEDPDFGAAAEALQVLERAGLLMGAVLGANKFVRREIGLTRLGRHALATNTVRQHLGLSDAPPTVSN